MKRRGEEFKVKVTAEDIPPLATDFVWDFDQKGGETVRPFKFDVQLVQLAATSTA